MPVVYEQPDGKLTMTWASFLCPISFRGEKAQTKRPRVSLVRCLERETRNGRFCSGEVRLGRKDVSNLKNLVAQVGLRTSLRKSLPLSVVMSKIFIG